MHYINQRVYSCETALMKIYTDLSEDLNSDSFVITTFWDFSTAIDTVDHNILIISLKAEFAENSFEHSILYFFLERCLCGGSNFFLV